jgi:hypothetical protein
LANGGGGKGTRTKFAGRGNPDFIADPPRAKLLAAMEEAVEALAKRIG